MINYPGVMEIKISNISRMIPSGTIRELFKILGNIQCFDLYPSIKRDGTFEADIVYTNISEAQRAIRLDKTELGDKYFSVGLVRNKYRFLSIAEANIKKKEKNLQVVSPSPSSCLANIPCETGHVDTNMSLATIATTATTITNGSTGTGNIVNTNFTTECKTILISIPESFFPLLNNNSHDVEIENETKIETEFKSMDKPDIKEPFPLQSIPFLSEEKSIKNIFDPEGGGNKGLVNVLALIDSPISSHSNSNSTFTNENDDKFKADIINTFLIEFVDREAMLRGILCAKQKGIQAIEATDAINPNAMRTKLENVYINGVPVSKLMLSPPIQSLSSSASYSNGGSNVANANSIDRKSVNSNGGSNDASYHYSHDRDRDYRDYRDKRNESLGRSKSPSNSSYSHSDRYFHSHNSHYNRTDDRRNSSNEHENHDRHHNSTNRHEDRRDYIYRKDDRHYYKKYSSPISSDKR